MIKRNKKKRLRSPSIDFDPPPPPPTLLFVPSNIMRGLTNDTTMPPDIESAVQENINTINRHNTQNSPHNSSSPNNNSSSATPEPSFIAAKNNGLLHRARDHFGQEIGQEWVDTVMILCCFLSGLVDSVAYNSWGCFVSMQTGMKLFICFLLYYFCAVFGRGGKKNKRRSERKRRSGI